MRFHFVLFLGERGCLVLYDFATLPAFSDEKFARSTQFGESNAVAPIHYSCRESLLR
jgi:hypothetical protein